MKAISEKQKQLILVKDNRVIGTMICSSSNGRKEERKKENRPQRRLPWYPGNTNEKDRSRGGAKR